MKAKELERNKRLANQGIKQLQTFRKNGQDKSRHELKLKQIEHQAITSDQSLKVHTGNWLLFCEWLEANEFELRTIGKITEEIIIAHLQDIAVHGGRDGKGASKKTLQTRLTALNKLLVGSGRIDDENKLTISELIKDGVLEIRKDDKLGHYKPLTSQEWIERNQAQYENNKQAIDTMRAFGLRDKELNELNIESFLLVKNLLTNEERLTVQTIGKGGKMRFVACRSDMEQQMLYYYSSIAKVKDSLLKRNKRYLFNQINQKSKRLNIKGANSHKIPKHIFRSEFAQELLKEKIKYYDEKYGNSLQNKGYSTIDVRRKGIHNYRTKIGIYEGNVKAFLDVSRSLGHNRLDVLLKYL